MADEVEVSDLRPSREVKQYQPFTTILDRILLRRIESEKSSDGYAIPDKYREPEAVGEVVCAGDGVVLGGQWFEMTRFLKVGDIVRYGEHTAEKYDVSKDPDFPDGDYFICRIQDLRGVRRLKNQQWIDTTTGEMWQEPNA